MGWLFPKTLQWRMESFTTWSGKMHSTGLVRDPHTCTTAHPSCQAQGLRALSQKSPCRGRIEVNAGGRDASSRQSQPDKDPSNKRHVCEWMRIARVAADFGPWMWEVWWCSGFQVVCVCVCECEPLTLASFNWRSGEKTCRTQKHCFYEPVRDCWHVQPVTGAKYSHWINYCLICLINV